MLPAEPAAEFAGRAHLAVEAHRLGLVDQPHRALVEALRGEEGVVGVGDDVDDRIADAQHVEAGLGHGHPVGRGKAALA